MSTLLTNLENNEAVLLMYLANELPAEDRAEVESMLQRDEQLRDQFDRIRAAYASLDAAIGRADAGTHMGSGFSAARSFGDEIRRRATAHASVDEKEEYHRRISVWWYPVIAAAMVAFGMLLWWKTATQVAETPVVANTPYYYQGGQLNAEDQEVLDLFATPFTEPLQDPLRSEIETVTFLRTNEAFW
jgi:anti-sigma-K factor RskA